MKKKILIVDDEMMIRELIRDFFELEDYDVEEASNGRVAFELIQQKKFDCVITDVRMPDGDGIELARKIHAMAGKKPSVIFMTGFSDITPAEASEIGILKILEKPFQPEDLVRLVGRWLS